MLTYDPIVKLYIAILVLVVLIWGVIYTWQDRVKRMGKVLSDQQVVWLLVGLLVIAFVSMGAFVLILLGGLYSWHYL